MKNRNINLTRSILQRRKARLFRLVPALGVIALVAVIMEASVPSAQADGFTLASLNGAYADSGSGFAGRTGVPVASAWAASGAGLFTFDGAGQFTANLVLNNAGMTIHLNLTGTYTVNADGTGTIDWVSFGTPRSRFFAIGDGGNQVRYVQTDTPPDWRRVRRHHGEAIAASHLCSPSQSAVTLPRAWRLCARIMPFLDPFRN
jgi:hypothetical protein